AADGRDQVDDAQARLRLLRGEPEGLVRVDGHEVLEVRQRAVVLRRKATGLLDLDQDAAPTSGVTNKPLDLRPVAQVEVPSDGARNHRVVAPGEIVLGGLPQESTAAIRELDYARQGRRRARRRNRGLAGIPRPSRPL